MRIARLDNTSLHWREDGDPDGYPVVFANSLGTDLRVWDKIVPHLPKNLRLFRFDKRGHGLSSCPPAPYSMADLARDTENLLDQLGVSNCVFVGLSIGGMIGQSLATHRPDLVRALVLSNTAAKLGEAETWQDRINAVRADGIASLAEPILDRWFSAAFRQNTEVAAWRNMLTRTPSEGYIGCCAAIAGTDLRATSAELHLPVLAIGGSEDLASPPELVRSTASLIPGATYKEIKGVGHLPCVEAPEKFATLIGDFIEETLNG
ncbi:3-oxoadipate enol-lactonase 2 [Ruegeria denitrificans]|uniref:3-oxoadipate enol-lactonase 2 n=1 Tax=Ruegeria denitrificans TaxID=1715692 RepID=A0A0P1IR67_9RHOB|nr:3-oxoadipate enol-lactonase [Ruegeria denitrificans]CUJ97063.1 3-oxoadipate enol-lactonase 2 [Ruegeria denitrificans]